MPVPIFWVEPMRTRTEPFLTRSKSACFFRIAIGVPDCGDFLGFWMSPACLIFMPVAAIVKVFPAPTTWARSVLPQLIPRQMASPGGGEARSSGSSGNSRCEPSNTRSRKLLYVSL